MIGLLARILAIPVRALRVALTDCEWTLLDDAEFARACRRAREDGGGSCR